MGLSIIERRDNRPCRSGERDLGCLVRLDRGRWRVGLEEADQALLMCHCHILKQEDKGMI